VYVCLCRVVTRKVIEAVIAGGARTVDDVAQRCGAGTECGKCRRTIGRLLQVDETPPHQIDTHVTSYSPG
jgi:bacterioferritin-associated ferredoxin